MSIPVHNLLYMVTKDLESAQEKLETASFALLGRHNVLATQFAGSVCSIEQTISAAADQLAAIAKDLERGLDVEELPAPDADAEPEKCCGQDCGACG